MNNISILFPTPVYRAPVAGHRKFKEAVVPKLLDTFNSGPHRQEDWAVLCNSWQVPLHEIASKDFDLISGDIQSAIGTYFEYLQTPPFDYEIFGWVNVHTSDMYQEVHNHVSETKSHGKAALIAGIYYLQFDRDAHRPVQFMNPDREFRTLMRTLSLDIENPSMAPKSYPNVSEGDLLLFPSTLDHFVPKSKPSNIHRISISFNVFPHVRSS